MSEDISEPLSGFEEFLHRFREVSGDPDLDYWADVIFVMRWNPGPLVEKRFMGGMPVWLVWALKTLLLERQSPSSVCPTHDDQTPVFGFRLLPTPAHHDTLAPLIREAGIEACRIFGSSPGNDSRNQVTIGFQGSVGNLTRRQRLVELVQSMRMLGRIRRILRRADPPAHQNPPGFWPRLIEQFLTFRIGLASLRKSEAPLRALFLTYELAAESKALVVWARENDIRTVHLMHGQRLPTYQVTRASDLVLFSKLDEAWFRERVHPRTKLWSFGHPRLESLRRRAAPPSPDSNRLPRITFFSQPAEGGYSRQERLADWRLLGTLAGRAELRFRAHPRESKTIAADDLRLAGLTFAQWSEGDLVEDLAWCDAVASSWSTVSMEAAACGRGVFWTCSTPERYGVPEELRKHGLGVLIRTESDWQEHLDAWHHGHWKAPLMVSEDQARALGIIGDIHVPWLRRFGLEDRPAPPHADSDSWRSLRFI